MKLAVYGAGGSGREVCDLFYECPSERCRWNEIVLIDDFTDKTEIYGHPAYSFESVVELYSPEELQVVIAIGEPKYRRDLREKIEAHHFKLGKVIHSNAKISPSSIIGDGVILQDGVIVSSDAIIGDNVYINHRTLIGHDVEISKDSQISANVVISGGTKIGECAFVGGAVCVRDHVIVGNDSIISMGSVVLRNVGANMIVMGNPAREIRNKEDAKVFK